MAILGLATPYGPRPAATPHLLELGLRPSDLSIQPLHAARADLLARTGDHDGARAACDRALALTGDTRIHAVSAARCAAPSD